MTSTFQADAPTILVVEDEDDVRELVLFNLRGVGYGAIGAASVAEARAALRSAEVAIAIVDRMLPDGDGLELVASVRGDPALAHLGLLVLTARGTERDCVIGLSAGADDYVVKPFAVRELLARVRVLVGLESDRRVLRRHEEIICFGDIVVDDRRHRVLVAGAPVELRPLEYRILVTMLAAPERIFSRAALIESVWHGFSPTSPRVVDANIRRLREALGEASGVIETVRGVGYRLRPRWT